MQVPNFKIPPVNPDILNSIEKKYFDIPYARASSSQVLDIYFPNEGAKKPYPVIIYLHGGAFMMGSKSDDALEPILRALNRGYVVVSAEYRKSGEAKFPAMVHDAKAVVRLVRLIADEYGLDSEKIAVWGPSSGGWLASFLGVTNDDPDFEDLSLGNEEYSSRVNAVIDWCGPCGNFLGMDEAFNKSGLGRADHNDPESPESRFLGAPITEVPELCLLSAPITHVSENTPPFCIFHGSIDQVVPVEQSISFADKIKSVCGEGRVELHIAEGKLHHGHPWYHEEWVSDACIDFLDKVFGRENK